MKLRRGTGRRGATPDEAVDGEGRSGFEGLFLSHYRGIFLLFRRHGFSPEDSEELAQETFLRAHAGFPGLRTESGAVLAAWLLRIATNVWKNELRRRSAGRRQGVELPLEGRWPGGAANGRPGAEPARGDPLTDAQTAETLEIVRRALGEMPVQMRRCLLLYSVEGLKYREIGVVLGISLDTVKSHIHRARERLRAEVRRGAQVGRGRAVERGR